jgi:hypothetical protein
MAEYMQGNAVTVDIPFPIRFALAAIPATTSFLRLPCMAVPTL